MINFSVLFSFIVAYGEITFVATVYAANNNAEVLVDYVAAVQGTASTITWTRLSRMDTLKAPA
jgi:hypothetical protein